jgi:hypothetical protein
VSQGTLQLEDHIPVIFNYSDDKLRYASAYVYCFS